MPFTRTLALRWCVSRGTLETVCGRLCAEGYLVRRSSAGTFVSATIPDGYLMARSIAPPRKQPLVAAQNPPSQQDELKLAHETCVCVGVPFVARLPDPNLFQQEHWLRLAVKTIEARDVCLAQRPDPAGLLALREQIAGYLHQFRRMDCTPQDILLTTGTRHAIDLICRSFIAVGDKVCVEDPCYPFARDIFALARADIAAVPMQADGLQMAALHRHSDAKLIYVTPAHQSPLRITMSVSCRLPLLEWVQSNGVVIIEDDYDSEFSYSGAPLPALTSLYLRFNAKFRRAAVDAVCRTGWRSMSQLDSPSGVQARIQAQGASWMPFSSSSRMVD